MTDSPTSGRRVFDIHPHIVSPDVDRYPVAPQGGHRSDWSKHRSVDFDQLLADMNAAGIERAAIVHSSTTYGYDASYLADAIGGHHDRFTGVFSIDVQAADAPERIQYWLDRGLSGLRLFAAGTTVSGSQAWIADPSTYPAWQYCADHDVPVALSLRQDGLPHLVDVLERFPTVRVILDHLLHAPMADGPPYAEAKPLFDMAAYPTVHLKLTPAIIRRSKVAPTSPETFFGKLMETFGSARIAWGSNYPAIDGSLPQLVAEAEKVLSILPEADQENIFWRTAAAFYPALADKSALAKSA